MFINKLLTEIFFRYLLSELQWKKIIKTKQKKNDDVPFLPTELQTE
jgi:hypothetical protein